MPTFTFALVPFLVATSLSFSQLPGQKEPIKVAVFLYNGVELLDFAGPSEVFAASGFSVFCVTADGLPITCNRTGSFLNKLTPAYGVENAPPADIIVLPGGASQASSDDSRVRRWVEQQHAAGRILLSVCTGAQILAKTRMLDGLTVTTWYGFIPGLQKMLPTSKVVEHTRFVDNGNIITTAGVSAGIDGALHLVDRLKGRSAALSTAKYMEYDKWKPDEGLIVKGAAEEALDDGNIDDAIRLYRQRPSMYLGDLINNTNRLLSHSKWPDAKKLAELVVKEYPGTFEGWELLGDACRGLKEPCPMNEQDFLDMIRQKGVSAGRVKFDEYQSKFSGWLIFSANAINNLGYALMEKNAEEAIGVLRMYADMYPNDANAFDSLAEAHWRNGNKAQAIANYEKSLTLDPTNANAVKMIEKIKATP